MKCIYCFQDHDVHEIRSIIYIYCCSEIQIDYASLRPKVIASLKDDVCFFHKLEEAIIHSGN